MGEINYTFTAQDQLSPILQAQSQSIQNLTNVTTSLGQALRTLTQTTTANQQTQQAQIQFFQRISQSAQATTEAVRNLNTQQKEGEQSTQRMGQALRTAFAVAGSLGIVTSIQGIVSALRQAVTASVELAAQRENLVAGFRGIAGSASAATETLRFLRAEANRTGTDFDTLARSYRNIEAASRGTAVAGNATREVFLGITEAGRVLGISQAEAGRALLAVEQIVSKGVVSQEELRGQLSEALPGATQIAARAFGVTTEQLNAMVKEGLSAEEFVRRFGPQLRREFGPGLEQATSTAAASFARLGNEIREISANIGQEILGLLRPAADAISRFLARRREIFETQQQEARVTVGGIPEGATEEERRRLLEIGRGLSTSAGPARRARIENEAEAIRARIRDRETARQREAAFAAEEDVISKGGVGPRPFENQRAQIRAARQQLDLELETIRQTERNSGVIFRGAEGDLDRQNLKVNVQRQGLEEINKILASTKGLHESLPADLQKELDALNQQYGIAVQLQDAAQKRVDDEREAERAAERTTRRKMREREQALEQLRALAFRLQTPREERPAAIAAALQAEFPQDTQIQAEAELVTRLAEEDRLRKAIAEDVEDYFEAEQRADKIRGKAEATQRALNNALQKALDLIQAPREERIETRLRAQFREARVDPTAAQDVQLRLVTDLERRRAQAKQIEDVFRDLGRSIEQTFEQLFGQIFSGGVTSARSFGLLVAQSLQQLFGRLAASLTITLLTVLASGQAGGREGSGIGGILAGLAARILPALFGAATTSGNASAGDLSSGAGLTYDPGPFNTNEGSTGLFSGLTIGSKAAGGIAYRPQLALIGDNPSRTGEAVVPLTGNRAIPVEMRGGGQSPQTIVIQLMQDFRGTIDPRALRTSPQEVVGIVARDITGDRTLRRVIMQHATR